MISTACWKVARTFFKPKGIPIKRNSTKLNVKVVSFLSALAFLDLPVPAVYVQCVRGGRITERVGALVHAWYEMRVPHCYGIQPSVVHAEAQRDVLSESEANRACELLQDQLNDSGVRAASSLGFFGIPGTLPGSIRRLVDRFGSRAQLYSVLSGPKFFRDGRSTCLKALLTAAAILAGQCHHLGRHTFRSPTSLCFLYLEFFRSHFLFSLCHRLLQWTLG